MSVRSVPLLEVALNGSRDHAGVPRTAEQLADAAATLAHAAAIEKVLMRAGVSIEQVHHGDGLARWAVNRRDLERGHGIRTGLEDTTVLPDGRPARDNAALVRAAAMIAAGSRVASR